MSEYSQGIFHDGAAILKDGAMMTVDNVVAELNSINELRYALELIATGYLSDPEEIARMALLGGGENG